MASEVDHDAVSIEVEAGSDVDELSRKSSNKGKSETF